ncbi:conserved hypothetical protein [Trichinella spiralis]|uniref:hypothetical protein n=1 Tax=Trichinella spiralis TaxID=6334 RepID=UPI0001EFB867|nr:conserved hypothetical protein [Trichinella spiralis]
MIFITTKAIIIHSTSFIHEGKRNAFPNGKLQHFIYGHHCSVDVDVVLVHPTLISGQYMLDSIFFESGSQCPLNISWKIESAWDVLNGDMKILYLLRSILLTVYFMCSRDRENLFIRYERSKQSVSIVSSFNDNRNFVTKSPAPLKLRSASQDAGGTFISASYNFCSVFGRCPTASKTVILFLIIFMISLPDDNYPSSHI